MGSEIQERFAAAVADPMLLSLTALEKAVLFLLHDVKCCVLACQTSSESL